LLTTRSSKHLSYRL